MNQQPSFYVIGFLSVVCFVGYDNIPAAACLVIGFVWGIVTACAVTRKEDDEARRDS